MEQVMASIRGYLKDFNFKENVQGLGSHVRGDVLAGYGGDGRASHGPCIWCGFRARVIAGMWSAVAAG